MTDIKGRFDFAKRPFFIIQIREKFVLLYRWLHAIRVR